MKAKKEVAGTITLQQFLARENLTYAQLRTMRKNGTAPKEKRLSAKNIRITLAEYERWTKQSNKVWRKPKVAAA